MPDGYAQWKMMGQKALTDADLRRAKKNAQALRKDKKWVERYGNVISFEAWCVATGYDPTKADGGEPYKRLRYYMLTSGQASEGAAGQNMFSGTEV